MSLDFKKESVLAEKLKYLYKMGLQQKKCIINNIDVEFTEHDALKKTMELYKLHSKRFNK